MGIIDTHAHVTYGELANRVDEIVKNALEHNVTRILIVSCTLEEAKKALEFAEKYDIFDCAFGYHPEYADEFYDSDFKDLREILSHPKSVALGEIGMDYHYTKENKEKQKQLFIRQIQLANELDLPILIHMRDATFDTIEILKEYPCKGIMHCYSGSLDSAKIILNLGYHISFAGPITFKNAKDAPEVCKYVPIERLFVETDAPFLTPHPFRGKMNEPYYTHITFEKVCEIKGMEPEVLIKQMEENYFNLFTKAKKK